MVKKFTIPFASQGDANDIPDALQVDGKVSFTQGFGYDYERPYDDPQAKDIAREDMNGLFKAITSAVGELQTLGASEWSSAISYPKGAIVYFEKDLYISQVDDNQNTPPKNWVSITSIANDSLKKAANLSDLTNKTTARSNLGLGSSATLNKTDVLGTSTSLVATQKLVNDTKINLENSKQDKLTFTGTGNVARMSEVEKKRDKDDNHFYGIDIMLNRGAYDSIGFYLTDDYQRGIVSKRGGSTYRYHGLPNKEGALALTSDIPLVTQSLGESTTLVASQALVNSVSTRTTTAQDRADSAYNLANSKITGGSVVQSTGASTTDVMSQKAVTDQLNSIESGHGLGYDQSWVDVTSQRVVGTTYTNNTGKPISVAVTLNLIDSGLEIIVDSIVIAKCGQIAGTGNDLNFVQAIIPQQSTYQVNILTGSSEPSELMWRELR